MLCYYFISPSRASDYVNKGHNQRTWFIRNVPKGLDVLPCINIHRLWVAPVVKPGSVVYGKLSTNKYNLCIYYVYHIKVNSSSMVYVLF